MDLLPKSIIDWLPPEILLVIFLLCSRRDQVSLFKTCKLFDDFETSILYKKITLPLPLPNSFESLCQTLSANPRKAGAVRHVTIAEPYPYPPPDLVPALNTALVVILRCLTKVEKIILDSRLFGQAYYEMLGNMSFPGLRCLVVGATYINTRLLPPFLHRHPGITKMTLNGATGFVGPIALPNARYLKASSLFVRGLSGHVPISTVIVSWDLCDRVCTSFLLIALSQHSGNSLRKLVCTCVGPIPGIIQGVAKHLPNIQTLCISSYATEGLQNEELDAITRSLGRFNFLRWLELDVAASDISMDPDVVSRWGQARPTLEICIVYGQAWRCEHERMKRAKRFEQEGTPREDFATLVPLFPPKTPTQGAPLLHSILAYRTREWFEGPGRLV